MFVTSAATNIRKSLLHRGIAMRLPIRLPKTAKTTRVYTCTICGDSYTQELGDQYDEVTSYVENLFEQYRPYMVWVFLATAAIWSIVMGVFFAIAHKNEDKEKARKMIVNYFIGLVVIFCILVACPYLIAELPLW